MRPALILALCTLLSANAIAADHPWQNLASLRLGQKIDVRAASGTLHGEFVRFNNDALTIRDKKGERSIAQAEVSRVSLAKSSRGLWIGLIAGGGGGAAAGAALGTRLANESAGDINIKGIATGGCAAAGALIGLAIGAAARRAPTIYQR